MRELWDYYIPTGIVNTMSNPNSSRKNLHKIISKYGGSLVKDEFKMIDLNRLNKRNISTVI